MIRLASDVSLRCSPSEVSERRKHPSTCILAPSRPVVALLLAIVSQALHLLILISRRGGSLSWSEQTRVSSLFSSGVWRDLDHCLLSQPGRLQSCRLLSSDNPLRQPLYLVRSRGFGLSPWPSVGRFSPFVSDSQPPRFALPASYPGPFTVPLRPRPFKGIHIPPQLASLWGHHPRLMPGLFFLSSFALRLLAR